MIYFLFSSVTGNPGGAPIESALSRDGRFLCVVESTAPDKSRSMGGPDPVDAHPKGASAFGMVAIFGNGRKNLSMNTLAAGS